MVFSSDTDMVTAMVPMGHVVGHGLVVRYMLDMVHWFEMMLRHRMVHRLSRLDR